MALNKQQKLELAQQRFNKFKNKQESKNIEKQQENENHQKNDILKEQEETKNDFKKESDLLENSILEFNLYADTEYEKIKKVTLNSYIQYTCLFCTKNY
jgi:hypothetical protein